MNKPLRILLIGSAPQCEELLRERGFAMAAAPDLAEGIKQLGLGGFALVLLDLELPGSHDLETFRLLHQAVPGMPVVVLISAREQSIAAEAVARGAQDYLLKEELSGPALARSLGNAIERHKFLHSGNGDRILLRALMEHIPDAIYFKDTASRFLMVSQAQAKRFGFADPEQATGKTDHDFFSRPHADQALADEMEIMKTGKPLVGVEEMETWPDGSTTWVSTTKMPLRDSKGQIVGTFGISRDITEQKRFREALAERTQQLERQNKQMTEELKMARELQMAMLPQEFPKFPVGRPAGESALEFFSFYYPTGVVSGDFFNVMALSDEKVGVFICDVMGHDVRAALVTAMMRALVQDLSLNAPSPGHLLGQINHGLHGIFRQTGATMYATAFYLVADVTRGEVQYASAAHPDPLQVRRRAGSVERLSGPDRTTKGPALGLFSEAKFPTHTRLLESGDLIAMYTDGLIETQSPDQRYFDAELLAEAVRRRVHLSATDLLSGVISEVREFTGQTEFEDDVCLVGMEVRRLEQVLEQLKN